VYCRYGFTSEQAAQEFMKRPAAYVAASRRVLSEHPDLVPVVGSMDPSLPQFVASVVDLGYYVVRMDCATQTPTHIVEQHIDHRCGQLAAKQIAIAALLIQITEGIEQISTCMRLQLSVERVGSETSSADAS
jgi:hypothetical protein